MFNSMSLFQHFAWMVPIGLGGISMTIGTIVECLLRGYDFSAPLPPGATIPVTVTVGLSLWGISIVVLCGSLVRSAWTGNFGGDY